MVAAIYAVDFPYTGGAPPTGDVLIFRHQFPVCFHLVSPDGWTDAGLGTLWTARTILVDGFWVDSALVAASGRVYSLRVPFSSAVRSATGRQLHCLLAARNARAAAAHLYRRPRLQRLPPALARFYTYCGFPTPHMSFGAVRCLCAYVFMFSTTPLRAAWRYSYVHVLYHRRFAAVLVPFYVHTTALWCG